MNVATTTGVRLAGRTDLVVRPLRPSDWCAVHELLDGLSHDARYLRFLRPLPDIPDWAVDSLCRPDDRDHVARIATSDRGRAAGIAQYFVHPIDPTIAEVAVTVATAYQRKGIGRVLLRRLAVEARATGIRSFTYVASPQNRAAMGLMHSLGATSHFSDGLIEGVVALDMLESTSRATSPVAMDLAESLAGSGPMGRTEWGCLDG